MSTNRVIPLNIAVGEGDIVIVPEGGWAPGGIGGSTIEQEMLRQNARQANPDTKPVLIIPPVKVNKVANVSTWWAQRSGIEKGLMLTGAAYFTYKFLKYITKSK